MQIVEQTSTKGRRLPRSLKIDMTPMVDLGFLLITFFIFTTHMGEANALKLSMPADGPPSDLCESCAMTVILAGGNKVAVYTGNWTTAIKNNTIQFTTYPGLRKMINEKRSAMKAMGMNPSQFMVLIKPGEGTTYSNTVDALDEMAISMVGKYAIVDMMKEEKEFVDRHAR